jgi:hypothetical protein
MEIRVREKSERSWCKYKAECEVSEVTEGICRLASEQSDEPRLWGKARLSE